MPTNLDKEKEIDFETLLSGLKRDFTRKFSEIEKSVRARDFSIFKKELTDEFEGVFEGDSILDFFDDDGQIIDRDNNVFVTIFGVEKAFYYDTPFCLSGDFWRAKHYYKSLRNALVRKTSGQPVDREAIKEINETFVGVLSGGVALEKNELFTSDNFEYRRSDGATFDFKDCATGIKALGILQMLLNRGALTDRTVVIIDEPEAHLHPAWIVEYARLLILINKRLGTRFFIATHNPDMTSAIRYVSEKEGTLETTRFYQAEPSSDSSFRYVFNEADADEKSIEPLFESFAQGLRKISEYSDGGETNDDE